MKRFFLFSLPLALIAIIAVSCELKSSISPTVQASAILYRTSATGVKDSISFADTLQVSDTVLLPLVVNGYYDYIKSLKAVADTNAIKVSFAWDEAHLSILTSAADPEHGYLEFVPEQVYVGLLTLQYIPLKAGSHTIELQITSAAPAGFSQWHGQFDVNVK